MTEIRTEDFDYDLPGGLVAYVPAARREASRLMVLDRDTGSLVHRTFRDVVTYLEPADVLVVNDTKVIKARLAGLKAGTGGKVEILLVRAQDERTWEVLVSPSRRVHAGTEIVIGGRYRCIVRERLEGAKRIVEFPDDEVSAVIDDVGEVPLPPYIKRAPEKFDVERYQTIYARKPGSVAAPTAGLHFSEEVIEGIRGRGVDVTSLTLHVGPGTFLPVKVSDPRQHTLEPEYFEIDGTCCESINRSRRSGGRIVAVGTTAVRTLETVADRVGEGQMEPMAGWTQKFILPPYRFKVVDVLITNLHLPRSTLLMLVCAFAGRELIMQAYEEAVRRRYRFFSYGDAMLIL
jgi:S-adenosylmethionine:tRNA ribosyltransferase-isomerase